MSNQTLLACVAWWFVFQAFLSIVLIVRAKPGDGPMPPPDGFLQLLRVLQLLWEVALSWSAFALLYA